MHRNRIALTAALCLLVAAPAALGQSLNDRIRDYNRRNGAVTSPVTSTVGSRRTIELSMRQIIQEVNIEAVPAKQAFQWWSLTTGVPLVMNWSALEVEGVDANTLITLRLRSVPADQLLRLMLQRVTPELTTLMYNTTPWYTEVMTRRQALKRSVVRVYVIEDLLLTIPRFENTQEFDLNSALSNTSSGGSAGPGVAQSSTSIFDKDQRDREPVKSKEERGEDLAQIIRDTIEPTIWIGNGGEYGSVRYFSGRLIVSAPEFVHQQIGIPSVSGTRAARRGSAYRGPSMRGVAGVADR